MEVGGRVATTEGFEMARQPPVIPSFARDWRFSRGPSSEQSPKVPGAAPGSRMPPLSGPAGLPGRTAARPEQPRRFSQNNGDFDAYGLIFNPEMGSVGEGLGEPASGGPDVDSGVTGLL
jgi:hypothetical protein